MSARQTTPRRLALAWLGLGVVSCGDSPAPADGPGIAVEIASVFALLGQAPDVIAKATLAALGRTTTVKPGWLAKLLITSLSFLPRRGRTLLVGQIMAGMTKAGASA